LAIPGDSYSPGFFVVILVAALQTAKEHVTLFGVFSAYGRRFGTQAGLTAGWSECLTA